jgi:hypothetical protein
VGFPHFESGGQPRRGVVPPESRRLWSRSCVRSLVRRLSEYCTRRIGGLGTRAPRCPHGRGPQAFRGD